MSKLKRLDAKLKNATLPKSGFVRLDQILAVYPIGRSTWWCGVKSGKLPPAVKLGPRTTVWRVEDIHNLIASHSVTSASNKTKISNNNFKEEHHG